MRKILLKFIQKIITNPVGFTLFLCATISVTVMIRYRWREDNWKGTVLSDGAGYYAYLPAIFIHHDLQYRFYLELRDKYGFGDLSGNFCQTHNGKLFNRYFCGTAIAQTPFFLIAWLIAYLSGQEVDGHSFIFYAGINMAALFYAMAGLYALSKYLRKFVKPTIAAATCGFIFLGTNLFNYTINEPSYSHVYSFGFIAIFIYLADQSIQNRSKRSYQLLALNAAMIVLIRPSNGMILFSLPFIAGSWSVFMSWLKNGLKISILPGVVICGIAPLLIQPILYYYQCGSFMTDGYKGEKFYFHQPHILNALFHYRAGVFPWSPITLLALPGLYYLWKKNSFSALAWIGFMFVNLWVISSWWAWHYTGTFGMRPLVDYMSFFGIAIAFLLDGGKNLIQHFMINGAAVCLMLIGHVFNYQIVRDILPHDLMTHDKYWYIFLKTNPEYSFDLDHPYSPDFPGNAKEILIRHYAFESLSEKPLPNVYSEFHVADTLNYSGKGLKHLFTLPLGELSGSEHFHLDLKVLVNYPSLHQSGEFIVQFKNGDQVLQTHGQKIVVPHYKTDNWNKFRMLVRTFDNLEKADSVTVLISNGVRYNILLQQLEFSLASF